MLSGRKVGRSERGKAHLLIHLAKTHLKCLIISSLSQARKDREHRVNIEESIPQGTLKIGTSGRWWSIHDGSD